MSLFLAFADALSQPASQPNQGMPMAIPLGVPRRVGTIHIPAGTITNTVAPSPIGMWRAHLRRYECN